MLTRLCSKLQSRGGGQRPSGRARGGGREGTVTQRGPCPALPRPLGEQGAAGRPRAVPGDSPLSTPARRLPSLSSGSRFNGRRRVRTAQTCGVTRSVIVTALCSFLPLPIRVLLELSRSPTSVRNLTRLRTTLFFAQRQAVLRAPEVARMSQFSDRCPGQRLSPHLHLSISCTVQARGHFPPE